MSRARTEEVESFIIAEVGNHPADIASFAAERFGMSRQAVHRHLGRLVERGTLIAVGATRGRRYLLNSQRDSILSVKLPVTPGMEEDRVWRAHVLPHLKDLPRNIFEICQYGFLEMFNNVIDHSAARSVQVQVGRPPGRVWIGIMDDGVGVFRKVASALGLAEEREAVLELTKGKFTTDPARHSGQGIFFTSRAFDGFVLASRGVFLVCQGGRSTPYDEALHGLAMQAGVVDGTAVYLTQSVTSDRTLKDLFDHYAMPDDEDYGFTRTQISVELLKIEDEGLVSRSQARRLLARLNRFREVDLDFARLDNIGQAFADEIFRVFRLEHPEIKVTWHHAAPDVERMIRRAEAAWAASLLDPTKETTP